MRRALVALPILLAAVLGTPVESVMAQEAALTDQDRADVARVEEYLNGIDTMQARFVQVSSNGDYAEGTVVLDRPSRIRFDYDPPNPVLLIADGLILLYYDRELEQASQVPLWETPLWFLLREDVNLGEGLEVLGVERGAAILTIRARQEDSPDQGEVTLVFGDRPLQLLRWEIIDSRGTKTQVALIDPRFGVEVDRELFSWSDLPGAGLPERNDR
jgi:outer membrane lipoprotein-sorting protein